MPGLLLALVPVAVGGAILYALGRKKSEGSPLKGKMQTVLPGQIWTFGIVTPFEMGTGHWHQFLASIADFGDVMGVTPGPADQAQGGFYYVITIRYFRKTQIATAGSYAESPEGRIVFKFVQQAPAGESA